MSERSHQIKLKPDFAANKSGHRLIYLEVHEAQIEGILMNALNAGISLKRISIERHPMKSIICIDGMPHAEINFRLITDDPSIKPSIRTAGKPCDRP